MRVAAIITTYNRRASLMHVLGRIGLESFDQVIVVNNASTDDTRAYLDALDDPKLSVIHLEENTGGAGGFSRGVMAGLERGDSLCDWFCLFDDDAWPAEGAVAKFKVIAEHLPENVGAVGAVVETPSGDICEMNRQGVNPFWHLGVFLRALIRGNREGFHLQNADLRPKSSAIDVDFNSFVGFFLRRSAAEEIGPPEAGLFIYGDDVLYSLKLRRRGWRISVEPSLRFVHDIETFRDDFVYRPLWKVYYHCRNGVEVARQAAGRVVFPFALLYYALIWARRGMACRGVERRLYYRLMWRGLRDGLCGKRGRCDAIHDLHDSRARARKSRARFMRL
ncbi:glycosyltransferase [Celeribacter sp. ULVN23_4]